MTPIKKITSALVVGGIVLTGLVATVSATGTPYMFRFKVKGVAPPLVTEDDPPDTDEPSEQAWVTYFTDAGQTPPSSWSDGFDGTGSQIPSEPYPASHITGGRIYLLGDNLTNIDGLSSIETVAQSIMLQNNKLTDVDGLSSLQSVGADLGLGSNHLTDVDGLSSLKSVGWRLWLDRNDLTNVDGLSSLETVGMGLSLTMNQLSNVDGLSSLTSVGQLFTLTVNQLTNVDGLSNLKSVGMSLELGHNPLTDLSGLSGITSLGVYVKIDADATIETPIPSNAWLCQPAQASKFKRLSQAEACGF